MAKKKVSHQSKQSQEHIQPQQHLDQAITTTTTTTPPMDDQSEKLQSLKSLNSLLLKETRERRLQVDDLMQSKKALESELTRSVMEKKELDAELTRASDETVGLELEKCLMGVFMETQMGDLGVEVDGLVRDRAEVEKKMEGLKIEIEKVKSQGKNENGILKKKVNGLIDDIEKERLVSSQVLRERDELKDKLGVQIEKANGLREKMVEMEERERKMVDEAQRQMMDYKGLVRERAEFEKKIEVLKREMEKVKNEGNNEIGVLKKKVNELIDDIGKEGEASNQLLHERDQLKDKLGVQIGEANELREKVVELEEIERKMIDEAQKQKMEYEGLVKERAEIEKKMEVLKRGMETVKSEGRNEIGILKKKVSELIDDIEKERQASSRVMQERDELKDKFGLQIVEANGLREKVVEMEEIERKMVDEAHKQKMEYEGTVKKTMEMEIAMKSLLKEKELAEQDLRESVRIIEVLKREIAKVNTAFEEERNRQVMKTKELEKEVNELTGTVMTLRQVEVGLNTKVSDLEKSNAEVVESRELMVMEFNVLQEQKQECERKIETLQEEKSLIIRSFEELEKKLEDQKRQIEGMIREKSGIEEVNASREIEIVELQKELGKLRDVVVTLQDTCKGQVEEMNRLESEISQCRYEIGRVTNERDDVERGFKKEKKNTTELRLKVSEMEKKFEESLKGMEQMKSEHGRIIEEKKELGSHCETLMGENAILQKSLLEHQQKLGDVRASLESKCDNSKWVLTMLKNTAALVNKLKDETDGNGSVEDLLTNEKKLEKGEEVQPYLVELEAIKDAFISNETKTEAMKRQLEFLQNSVVEANKKKSFWTLISSASTLLVAASIAYAARGH